MTKRPSWMDDLHIASTVDPEDPELTNDETSLLYEWLEECLSDDEFDAVLAFAVNVTNHALDEVVSAAVNNTPTIKGYEAETLRQLNKGRLN